MSDTPQELVVLSKAQRMLAKAQTIDEILHIENMAQRARDYAKAAGLGRKTTNTAARVMLDARRKAGRTLKAMKERGEFVDGRPKKRSQDGTVSLTDLALTKNQSSRYQHEGEVPDEIYVTWADKIEASPDGLLTASALRTLASQNGHLGSSSGTTAIHQREYHLQGFLRAVVTAGEIRFRLPRSAVLRERRSTLQAQHG